MKLIAIDRWADTGAGFNRQAADAVYKSMTAMDPDAALLYGRILLNDSVHYDLIAHRQELADTAQRIVTKRAETLRAHYSRTAVDKARNGQDTTKEIACLVQIGKAFDYTTGQRRQFAAGQPRGPQGRYVEDHRRIDTDDTAGAMDPAHALRRGIDIPPAVGLPNEEDLSHYQQAYQQIQDLLGPFHNQQLNPLLHLQVEKDGVTTERTVAVGQGRGDTDVARVLDPGSRIRSAAVSVTPVGAPGAAFDVMSTLLGNRAGGQAASLYDGPLGIGPLGEYNARRTKPAPNDPHSSATRAFGRLSNGSQLLQDSIGDAAPPQLQYALAVANHVGQFGPEAQKVFGPAADRAAYRYRGTERTLDPRLRSAFESNKRIDRPNPEDRRELAFRGTYSRENKWIPGAVLNYFRKQLPNPDLNELQRRSGVIPPSEGIIINAQGMVTHQSIGFADDWYLPFNLRHLAALKGGEYIRTRTFGGPTTEDIYTGLVTGAKSLAVVSHSGVYEVNFDENLRGGRRFNDKAARMVARYGHLLDALKSRQVARGGISGPRMQELQALARDVEPDETLPAYTAKLNELKVKERRDPDLAASEKAAAAVDWLGSIAGAQGDNEGRFLRPENLIADLIAREQKKAVLTFKESAARYGQPFGRAETEQVQQDVAARFNTNGDPEQIVRQYAEATNQTAKLERFLLDAKMANKERVQPLQLDGQGYFDALQALHEQFPYYIKPPLYHPWKDSVGMGAESTHERATDTGYVLPQHNRPHDAEAGYFDDAVTGQPKVYADTTRYQNFRVHQGVPVKVVSDKPATGAAGMAATAAAAAIAAGTPAGMAAAMVRRKAADTAMEQELRSKTHFGPNATMGGVSVADQPIGKVLKDRDLPPQYASIARFYNMTTDEWLANPDQHGVMERVLALVKRDKLFDVKESALATFNAKGVPVEAKPAPTDLTQVLAEIGVDHVFPNGGIAYDPLRTPTVKQVKDTYLSEPNIRHLVTAGDLPEVDAADFDAKAKTLKRQLIELAADHKRTRDAGLAPDRRMAEKLEKDADGLQRAAQLNRQWAKAKDAEPPEPEPESGPDVSHQFSVVLPPNFGSLDPTQQAGLLGQVKQAGVNARKIINNDPDWEK